MGVHPEFPKSPYAEPIPEQRWFPAVCTASGEVFIIKTKGREEIDLPQKMRRMKEWCADATSASRAIGGPAYRHVFVDREGFEKHTPRDFAGLVKTFREFQE